MLTLALRVFDSCVDEANAGVHVVGLERTYIIEEYAPWASGAIQTDAQLEAVGRIMRADIETGETSLHIPENPEDINHWVACVKSIPGHGDGAPQVSDASTDETWHFAAVYLSVCRIVIETIADGSCGVDVMCLMLGLRRAKDVRRAVRWELGAFLLKHCWNRALVQSMFTLGEVDRHMGLF